MIIKYFVPEDGDEEDHPNVFVMHVTKPINTFWSVDAINATTGVFVGYEWDRR